MNIQITTPGFFSRFGKNSRIFSHKLKQKTQEIGKFNPKIVKKNPSIFFEKLTFFLGQTHIFLEKLAFSSKNSRIFEKLKQLF